MFEKHIAITDEFLDDLNHVNYLNYVRLLGEATFEEDRTARGIDLQQLQAEFNVALVVAEFSAKYFLPLKLGDTAIVKLHPSKIIDNKLVAFAEIKKRGRLMAELSMTMMPVDFGSGKPCEMPQAVHQRIAQRPLAA